MLSSGLAQQRCSSSWQRCCYARAPLRWTCCCSPTRTAASPSPECPPASWLHWKELPYDAIARNSSVPFNNTELHCLNSSTLPSSFLPVQSGAFSCDETSDPAHFAAFEWRDSGNCSGASPFLAYLSGSKTFAGECLPMEILNFSTPATGNYSVALLYAQFSCNGSASGAPNAAAAAADRSALTALLVLAAAASALLLL